MMGRAPVSDGYILCWGVLSLRLHSISLNNYVNLINTINRWEMMCSMKLPFVCLCICVSLGQLFRPVTEENHNNHELRTTPNLTHTYCVLVWIEWPCNALCRVHEHVVLLVHQCVRVSDCYALLV